MRLFTAIRFDEAVKNRLCGIIDALKDAALGGSFTRRQNLHLTLCFLGEIDAGRVHSVKQAVDQINENPFTLELNGVGRFARDNGEIFWVGVNRCLPLLSVYNQLSERLSQAGFSVETRQYRPHLTLARELHLPADFDREGLARQSGVIRVPVTGIDLMKSERVDGVLTYTRIHTKTLSS